MVLQLLKPDDRADGRRPVRRRRRWKDKFREAFRGIKTGVRGHSSFFVHIFFAALVVTAAAVLQCDLIEWAVLLGCIGAVFTAELFNSAIETIYHGLEPAEKARIKASLDIAAGAVLVAAITAAIIGLMVFGNRAVDFVARIWN